MIDDMNIDFDTMREKLRSIALGCGLTQEKKWYQPCFTYGKANIVIIGKLKDCVVLSFFKGALLKDASSILDAPGPNTQSARVVRFTDVTQIVRLEAVLKSYIFEAIEVEKAGLKPSFKKAGEHDIPEELSARFGEDESVRTAFGALTPGRQRSWLLHISSAKQAGTRVSRAEKAIPQILAGKGFNE